MLNNTLVEHLTDNFYKWEIKGRGWQVWNYPVSLEPAFDPFFHYLPQQPQEYVDDGIKPSFFSKVMDSFKEEEYVEEEVKAEILDELDSQLRKQFDHDLIFISALKKENMAHLRDKLEKMVQNQYKIRYPHQPKKW